MSIGNAQQIQFPPLPPPPSQPRRRAHRSFPPLAVDAPVCPQPLPCGRLSRRAPRPPRAEASAAAAAQQSQSSWEAGPPAPPKKFPWNPKAMACGTSALPSSFIVRASSTRR